MAQELPGFYFDAELNRYYPLSRKRGRSGTTVPGAASSSTQDDNKQGSGLNASPDPSILHLLQARETNSGMSRGSCGEQGFQTRFFESQAAHPQVWEYDKTRSLADGALQQLRVTCQTLEGERDADILVLGGSTGLFQLRGTTLLDGIQPSPLDIVRPRRSVPRHGVTRSEREPPGLWSVMDGSQFSSRITAIKRLGQEAAQPQQSAIMTTLGAGKVCGSLYVLDFKQGPEIQEWDRNCLVPFQVQRRVFSPCSVWTAEASPNGIAASLGMDSGAGLVALERSDVTWLCRSGSAVLSQQFDKQGNILFCGFRNGAISTIDLRKPVPKEATSHHEGAAHKSLKYQQRTSHSFGNGKHSNKRRVADYYCSHSKIMRMGSAVCSLLLLPNDENYLLASEMNGVIQQWDRRMVDNGAVRTFEGHNNTHTTLQLAVDPTETLLVSGGEDCALRIWSLASGRLLHAAEGLSSPASCICWPAMMRVQRKGRFWEESPFESDFSWGFWFGSSSGLHYMHGAG